MGNNEVTEVGMQGQRGRTGRAALCVFAALFVFAMGAQSAAAVAPVISEVKAVAVTESSATLKVKIDPKGSVTYLFEYGTEDCEVSACIRVGKGTFSGSATVRAVTIEGLASGTLYHFRAVAKHPISPTEEVVSPDRTFLTRPGIFNGLPDGRAYEQASPTDKDGNDAMGDIPTVKATASGNGITFASTFGIPGGKGAQEFPTYLASRGTGNWSTQGLLPPPDTGERAQIIGWSPDYTEVFSIVSKLDAQKVSALIVQSTSGGAPVEITPYLPKAAYFYSGQSKDGSIVLFESREKLTDEALAGFPNLYVWDRKTGTLLLAGVTNKETSPPKGTISGSYEWTEGIAPQSLRLGGSLRGFYLRDEHAIGPDGSIYFTEAGTGQLYRRINPTAPQSAIQLNAKDEEECLDSAKACTVHVSFTHKENGKGKNPEGSDSVGRQPAAFQAASADGSEVFFTSPEKLTDDANTGPEQAPAQIELGNPETGAIEKAEFIPSTALGVAADSEHVYWVDPTTNTISRADLGGAPASIEAEFIKPGTVECEVKDKPGEFEDVASRPRYVAVDSEYVYWTNTGCSNEFGPIEGTGTIGRTKLDGSNPPTVIEPEFITGASNPQGIAVNGENIYWANAGRFADTAGIARAEIGGGNVQQSFQPFVRTPTGVALSSEYVYFGYNEAEDDHGYVKQIPLDGGEEKLIFLDKAGIRGVAVDSGHVYWANQAEEAIGRADLDFSNPNKQFVPLKGKPVGVAVDANHLYWSTNGESPTNPGNDLYRYGPGKGQLEDLTPDASGNGAEVQGVVSASADGKYVYFAANGVLAAGASAGECEGPLGSAKGSCSLYLWHEGTISFVAPLEAGGGQSFSDALNWAATPRGQFGTAGYFPKTSFISADGQSLLFRSQEKLTAYDNEGVPQFYRFEVGEGISCATCNPAGEAGAGGAQLGRILFPSLGPLASVNAVSSRNFASGGDKFFFETPEALVPEDTNGQIQCPLTGTSAQNYPACNDVYEWEAAGSPGCPESSPAFSPINKGCIFLLSSGKSAFPSLFADASATGDDVFFFTRQSLVGQDKDELQDVYDAKVGGGLAAQNPVALIPCEGSESCHGPVPAPPAEPPAGSATFVGPGDLVVKHKKPKKKNNKKQKKHKGKKGGKGKAQKKAKRAAAKGRQGR